VLFEIQSVGNVKIPTPVDPLPPAATYSYKIPHAPGSKPEQLVPPFRVKSESADSFDLQIASASKGDGLAWLMRIGFVTTEGQKVYTEPFQLVLLGAG